MTNPLKNAASSYLRAHADNAIQWRSWGAAAQAEAAGQNKPILLSIGYMGCHWCHVMNTESFSDAGIAALINDNYIPVLVDRDERPDIDLLYQGAASVMRHNGGWPLNIFLDPQGAPFWVAGYLPPDERAGMPSFRTLLRDNAELFKTNQTKVTETTAAVRSALENLYSRDMKSPQENISQDLAALRIAQRYDIFFGGMQGPMKFLNPLMLEVLWRGFLRTGMPQFSQLVFTTLDSILFGGAYDHIGGGFFRHTMDERWLEPSFEKMLSDNAQMIEFCTGVWQFNRNELCRQGVSETIGWLLREMKLGDGFAAVQASGAQDEDARFYLWSEAEIDAALVGTFSARFKQLYGISRDGNMAGRNLPRRLGNPLPGSAADEALLAKQRETLLMLRTKRGLPHREDRLLADWNGLTIAALARAGAAFEKREWIDAAIAAFDFVVKTLGTGDRLAHSAAGDAKGALIKGVGGFADDYANMARAALQLWEVTGDERFLAPARAWTKTLNEFFWNTSLGGYCYTASDAEPLFVRPRMLFENPAPSANGTMLTVLTRLGLLTGEADYVSRAAALANSFGDEANRVLNASGTFLTGLECLANSLVILVIGHKGNVRTQDLIRAVWSKPMPTGMVVQIEPGEPLPAGHPASGRGMEGGQPTAYICMGQRCSNGFTSAAALAQGLILPPQLAQQVAQQAAQQKTA